MTAPSLSIAVTICATTFFGAVSGDKFFLFLKFHRHSSSHLSHLPFELENSTIFCIILISFIALFFVISAASLLFVSCLGGDSIFSFFPDKKPSSYLLVFPFWILESNSLFKWRLHFFHPLIFLSRDLVLSSILSLIIHHGLFI